MRRLSQPILEYGSPIASPYALQGSYDVENSTTTLTWIDISTVDSSKTDTHTTSLWSHTSAANPTNWDSLVKTEIASNLSSDVSQFEIVHSQPVSQTMFYTFCIHLLENQTHGCCLVIHWLKEFLKTTQVPPSLVRLSLHSIRQLPSHHSTGTDRQLKMLTIHYTSGEALQ